MFSQFSEIKTVKAISDQFKPCSLKTKVVNISAKTSLASYLRYAMACGKFHKFMPSIFVKLSFYQNLCGACYQ